MKFIEGMNQVMDIIDDERMATREGVLNIVKELKVYYTFLKQHRMIILNMNRANDGYAKVYFEA